MRAGINLHLLSTTHTGIQHYIRSLVPSLIAQGAKHQFVLFGDSAQLEGLPHDRVEWVSTASPLRSGWRRVVWEQLRLPALLPRYEVQVFFSPAFALPLSWKGRGVVVVHDLNFEVSPQTIHPVRRIYLQQITRRSVHNAAAVVAISQATANEVIQRYQVPEQKVRVIPYGLDATFTPEHASQLEAQCRRLYQLPERFLLFVGTLEPRKNLLRLLEGYAIAHREVSLPPLLLVGAPGWQHHRIQQRACDLGIAERIQFAGYIPREHLPGVYAAATALLYPSLYEGFGLPPLEAMGCGTPVLASNTSAIPEVVGEAGLLVDPYDVQAVAWGILRVATEEGLRQQLIAAGLQRARQFSWEKAAQRTLALLEEVAPNAA